MKKTIIISVSIIAVIVIIIFALAVKNPKSEIGGLQNSQTTSQTSGKKIAFEQLVKQGGSYECTVHQYINDTDTVGTVKIKNGNLRGTFSTNYNGMDFDGEVIIKDGYSYSWTSAMPSMGFKAKITQDEFGNVAAGSSGKYTWNYAQIGDYDCKAATIPDSTFAVPATVNFTTVS